MLPLHKMKLTHAAAAESLRYARISAPENENPYVEITNAYALIRIPLLALFGDGWEEIAEAVRTSSPKNSQALFLIEGWKAGKFHSAFEIKLGSSDPDGFTLKAIDKKGFVTGEIPVLGVNPDDPKQLRFPNTDSVIPSEEQLTSAEPINQIAFSMNCVNDVSGVLNHDRYRFRFTGAKKIMEMTPVFDPNEKQPPIAGTRAWVMPIVIMEE